VDNYDDIMEWLEYAQRDYDIALHLYKTFRPLPAENICYNSQQAVEKALKAMLILHIGDYRKTHDIRELHQMCKEVGADFGLEQSTTRLLTRFATKSRYPDEVFDFTESDAEIGLRYAKQVLEQAQCILANARMADEKNGADDTCY